MTFDRLGGIASLVCGLTYVFGFVVLVVALEPAGFLRTDRTAAETVTLITDQKTILSLWYLVIYALNAVALIVLVLALEARLSALSAIAARISMGMGLVWATLVLGAGMAANVGLSVAVARGAEDAGLGAQIWQTTELIENGIGGGNEIAGAVWVLVVSLAGLSGGLPRFLCWLGFVIGAGGLLTLTPLGDAAGAVFGLGFIVWFFWTGAVMVRQNR